MGVFDFIRDAGAQIGIGESEPDEAANEAPSGEADSAGENGQDADGVSAKPGQRETVRREKVGGSATDAPEQHDRPERGAGRPPASDEIRREKRREGQKSRELERYVRQLGLEAEDLDIRFDDGTAFIEGVVARQVDKERIILAVGNVRGVARVEENIDVRSRGEKAQMYTVKKGDTLSQIAKDFYGDPMRYPEIFEANRPMLKDPDLIYPGQVLRIPAA